VGLPVGRGGLRLTFDHGDDIAVVRGEAAIDEQQVTIEDAGVL